MSDDFNFKAVLRAFILALILFFGYSIFTVGINIFSDKFVWYLLFCCLELALNYGITNNIGNLNKLNVLMFLFTAALPAITKATDSAWSVNNQYGEYLTPFSWLIFVELLYSILFMEKKNNLFLKLLAIIPLWCYFAIQTLIIFYFIATKALLNDFAVLAVCQTNFSEAMAYIHDYLSYGYIAIVLVLFFALFIFLWRIMSNYDSKKVGKHSKNLITIILSIFMMADLYVAFMVCPSNFIKRTSYSVVNAFDTYKEFRELREKTKNEKQSSAFKAEYIGHMPSTYVIIIGESETRDHMGAYGYFRTTTPWLTQEAKTNPNFILFNNAYASDHATTKVLALALTEANQYNGVTLNKALSLLDIAKKAGFETVWLSNQMQYGKFDSPTTIIAESADKQIWKNSNFGLFTKTTNYDEALLKELKLLGTSEKNRLIIIHLMGCHSSYTDRYPPNRKHFTSTTDVPNDVKDKERYNTYDDNVLYNDYVLSQLFSIAKNQLQASTITYFSDHGEELVKGYGHNPILEKFDYTLLRIPFFVEINSTEEGEKEIVKNLKTNQSKFFTNDIVYDTQIGLMQIQTNRTNDCYDLASKNFNIETQKLIATEKKRQIIDDPKISATDWSKAD